MASRLLLGHEAMMDVIAPQESYVRRPKDVRAHLRRKRRVQGARFAVVDEGGLEGRNRLVCVCVLQCWVSLCGWESKLVPLPPNNSKSLVNWYSSDLAAQIWYHGFHTIPNVQIRIKLNAITSSWVVNLSYNRTNLEWYHVKHFGGRTLVFEVVGEEIPCDCHTPRWKMDGEMAETIQGPRHFSFALAWNDASRCLWPFKSVTWWCLLGSHLMWG